MKGGAESMRVAKAWNRGPSVVRKAALYSGEATAICDNFRGELKETNRFQVFLSSREGRT